MHPLIPFWDRVVIPVGPLSIHGFGILVALGFMFGSRIARAKAERDGLDPEPINQVVGWIVAGVFLGGHLGHLLFYYP
jgi:phosphatidylglycerol:prolipoprotein diacylglycerol transferase